MSVAGRRLTVAVVYPDLLGTYGDGGNGIVLARRADWRGIEVELLQATSDRPLPPADLYTIGGGEDGPQVRAASGNVRPTSWKPAHTARTTAPASTRSASLPSSISDVAARTWGPSSPPPMV